jgi:hypothetical protein
MDQLGGIINGNACTMGMIIDLRSSGGSSMGMIIDLSGDGVSAEQLVGNAEIAGPFDEGFQSRPQ